MKRSDLEPGVVYALASYGGYRPLAHVTAVVVVSLDPVRRAKYHSEGRGTVTTVSGESLVPPYGFAADPKGGSLLVQKVDPTTGKPLGRAAADGVAASKIAMTWADHLVQVAEAEAAEAGAQQRRAERIKATRVREARVRELVGDDLFERLLHDYGQASHLDPNGYHRLSSHDVADLVEAAYEAGRAAAEG